MALGLWCLLVALPAAATVIDDFAVAQGPLSDPPGTPDFGAVAAGLGGERDLFVDLLTGAGTLTAEATGGALEIDVAPDTTPDSRGEVVITWDGVDGAAALDPTGLGGLDLTDDGGVVQTGLRLVLAATDDGAEVSIEVFTDATHASRIDLVLRAAQTEYVLGYADFASSGTAGAADFAAVGAVRVTIRSTEKAIDVDELRTQAPAVDALMVDALEVDNDLDTQADAGDTLRYQVTIANTGTEAGQVDVNDMLSDLALVGGSVRTSPLARNDRYDDEACGNVTLEITNPAQGLLANDLDLDANPLNVDVAASDVASVQGGTVAINADGTFTYDPPPGFRGLDAFSYQLAIAAGDPTPPAPVRATVTLAVDERVWFVDNDHPGSNEGTQANPFQTLAAMEALAEAGDTIFIFEDDGTTTGLDTGVVLEDGQRLIGHGVDLVACGQTLISASLNPPNLRNVGGHVITLGADNEVRGVILEPTASAGITGNGSSNTVVADTVITTAAASDGVFLTNHGGGFTMTANNMIGGASSGKAVVIAGGSGTFSFNTTPISKSGGGLIDVSGAAATFDFTATLPTLTAGGDDAITLQGNPGSVFTFDAIGALATAAGGGLLIGGSGTVNLNTIGAVAATGAPAVDIGGTTVVKTGGPGAVTFASLSSMTSGTSGVRLDGVAPPVTVSGTTAVSGAAAAGIRLNASGAATFTGAATVSGASGLIATSTGTVTFANATSTLAGTAGPGADISMTTVAMTLAGVSSAGSATTGVNLSGVGGSFVAAGGSITGSTGTAFNVSAGGGTVTYGGAITNNSGRAVEVTSRTGGAVTFQTGTIAESGVGLRVASNAAGSVSFNGEVNVTDSSGAAVRVESNTGGSTSFADLDVDNGTSNQIGILATANGGAHTLSSTTGTIDAGSNTAVDIDNTVLGMNLVRIDSVSGGAVGLDLLDTTGSFAVLGDGNGLRNGSGGTISGKTGRGIRINRVTNVTLDSINVSNTGDDGIFGGDETVPAGTDRVTGLTMRGSVFSSNGNAANEHGMEFRDLHGTVLFDNVRVTNSGEHGIVHFNDSGTIDSLTFQNSEIDNLTSGAGYNFELKSGAGNPNLTTGMVASNNAHDNFSTALFFVNNGGGTVGSLTIQGNTLTDNNIAIDVSMGAANNDTTFNIVNNLTILRNTSHAINVFSANTAGDTSANVINGTISGNVIGDGTAGSGSTTGTGIRVNLSDPIDAAVHIDNNQIRNVKGRGIEAVGRLGGGGGNAAFTITSNVIVKDKGTPLTGDTFAGIFVSADGNSVCANIRGNNVDGDICESFGVPGFVFLGCDFLLQEVTGSAFQLESGATDCGGAACANARSHILGTNTAVNGTAEEIDENGMIANGNIALVAPGTCDTP